MVRVSIRHKGVMSTTKRFEPRGTIKGRVRSPSSSPLCINLDSMLGAREINIQISARNDPGEGVEYGVESI